MSTDTLEQNTSEVKKTKLEIDVDIKSIFTDHEFNCRGDVITPGSVTELAADIAANPIGLMQRIILQPWKHEVKPEIKYRVVAGNRRFSACKMLKWKTIPSVIFVGLSDEEAEVINLTENLKRKDLNMLQEARALDKMSARGMTPGEIAKRIDMGTTWVNQRLLLLQLPEDVQQEAAAGIIKAAHIQELVKLSKLSLDRMYEGVRNIKNANGRRKIIVRIPAAQEPVKKREFRKMSDVFKVQDACVDAIGTNLGSQALAWVINEIDTLEFLGAIKKEAVMLGLPWSIPSEFIEQAALEKKVNEQRTKMEAIEIG